jgi:hypothetical protein
MGQPAIALPRLEMFFVVNGRRKRTSVPEENSNDTKRRGTCTNMGPQIQRSGGFKTVNRQKCMHRL